MTVLISAAGPDDAATVGALIADLDAHYLGPERAPRPRDAADMARAALSTREGSRILIARVDGAPAGLAIFAILRPGRALSGVIHLKELYVGAAFRNSGVGLALMRALAREARRLGIGRIDLTTDAGNADAIRFYLRHGGREQPKRFFRFADADLAALAEGLD